MLILKTDNNSISEKKELIIQDLMQLQIRQLFFWIKKVLCSSMIYMDILDYHKVLKDRIDLRAIFFDDAKSGTCGGRADWLS